MHPGDQHKMPGASANPFEEPRISPFTAVEIATLQAKLDQQLGPEFISSRPGPGGSKVHYIQAEKCINLANQVFGFNGWNSSIQNMTIDFCDQSKDGKWNIGLSVIVRVTLRDGTYHEDVGYGHMENGKTKAAVFDKAKKEGTTDGLKRALRNFGRVLGNCLQDPHYMSQISRIKAPAPIFDPNKLHRHWEPPTLAKGEETPPVRRENVEPQPTGSDKSNSNIPPASPEEFDEYGGDEFEELGIFDAEDGTFDDIMPDEVVVNPRAPAGNAQGSGISKPCPPVNAQGSRGERAPQNISAAPTGGIGRSRPTGHEDSTYRQSNARTEPAVSNTKPAAQTSPQAPQQFNVGQKPTVLSRTNGYATSPPVAMPAVARAAPEPMNQQPSRSPNQPPKTPSVPTIQAPPIHGPPETPNNNAQISPSVGFVSGRAAVSPDGDFKPLAQRFDPHRPTSIRRSKGIDHSKSSPVPKKQIQPQNDHPGPNRPNPDTTTTSLGANRAMGYPGQNWNNSFRAPGPSNAGALAGTKRPMDFAASSDSRSASRAALGPTNGTSLNAPNKEGFGDSKRPRT